MIINVNGLSYVKVEYKDFIADNLSENGVVIFEPGEIDYKKVKKFIDERGKYLGQIKHLNFLVYDENKGKIERFDLFLNNKKNSPFAFFDFFRTMVNLFRLNYFFAIDYKGDSLFKINIFGLEKIGRVKEFKNIINLKKNRFVIFRKIKFAASEGLYFYQKPLVFRNEVERDFYTYKEILGDNFDRFDCLEECGNRFNKEDMVLTFDRDTILDFDIDCPELTLRAKALKAKNLNIKKLIAEDQDVFCDQLNCQNIYVNSILAEGIRCQEIFARAVKTNYQFGLRLTT